MEQPISTGNPYKSAGKLAVLGVFIGKFADIEDRPNSLVFFIIY